MKILMLKGLPGSGKSTWAKEFVAQNQGWVRVNKDTIRDMIVYRRGDEDLIIKFRDTLIRRALEAGKNVIVDDTNFHPKHEQALRGIAEGLFAAFEVKEFDTPLHDCIKNDLKRSKSVGERVIRRMHEDYVRPVVQEAWPKNLHARKAIICDLDGTLALANHRDVYDASTCDKDDINAPVANIVRAYAVQGYDVLYTSGRDETYRPQTEKFLARTGIWWYKLFMRPAGDKRKDHVMKRELYQKYIQDNYNVEVVLDDRQRVVDMWRDLGLTVLQVADGNF